MVTATKHFDCLLTDYLHQWHLQIIKKHSLFYVVQRRKGEVKRLLNGGNINCAWGIVETVLQQPFQTAVVEQHLDLKLSTNNLISTDNVRPDHETLVVVGINNGSYSLAKMNSLNDLSTATEIKSQFRSAISSLRLFDTVIANVEELIVIEKRCS